MTQDKVAYFAETDLKNETVSFGIKAADRLGHMYVAGELGLGKSALLENLAIQDIQNGEGLAYLDPYGASAERLLNYVPATRVNDVVYFDLSDSEHPIGFNFLAGVEKDQRHLVAGSLVSFFKKYWQDIWSPRIEHLFLNALLALLEHQGSSLIDLSRMFYDKDYRSEVLESVTDPTVGSFWLNDFSRHGDRYIEEAALAIKDKIDQLSLNPFMSSIIDESHPGLDIPKLVREKKILLANLSGEKVGQENANLLGGLLAIRIYLAQMPQKDPFYLYADEFQSFFNENFKEILTGSVKYKLGLVLANSRLAELPAETQSALLNNVGTIIAFRVGASDARILEKLFAPKFEVPDLISLPAQKIALVLRIDGVSSKPFSAFALPRLERPTISHKDKIIASSRANYPKPKEVPKRVLEEILK